MIKINRTNKPNILRKNEDVWISKLQAAIRLYDAQPSLANTKKKRNAEKKYQQEEIKEALSEMFSGKCAYCESDISHISYKHIEHFYPKTKYPGLCFKWNNMLLSCPVCNGAKYKGDKCPSTNDGGPFVNPVEENPSDFFSFEFDENTGTANVIPLCRRAEVTEKELGLNRPELVKHRSAVVRMIACVAVMAKRGDQNSLLMLTECCSKAHEYAAFARAIVQHLSIQI